MITNRGGDHECADIRNSRMQAQATRGRKGLWVLALTAIVLVTLTPIHRKDEGVGVLTG